MWLDRVERMKDSPFHHVRHAVQSRRRLVTLAARRAQLHL
ncbi:unnamed protein product [Thelazia callipaeda]|nr:unnamed protein product [Thelazia callipaeda]